MAAYDINYYLPLYLYPDGPDRNYTRKDAIEWADRGLMAAARRGDLAPAEWTSKAERMRELFERYFPEEAYRWPNLSPEFILEMSEQLGLEFVPDERGDLTSRVGPEDVFHYAYAIFHSPTYRERYAEFIKRDFPRLPLTSDRSVFAALCTKGMELVGLHLMTSPMLDHFITRFPEGGDSVVEKVRYDAANERIYINNTQHFEGVQGEIWGFRVGGYQVLDKWLKDRRGRRLSSADIRHYQRIVVAITETRRLMREVDETIPGWPVV